MGIRTTILLGVTNRSSTEHAPCGPEAGMLVTVVFLIRNQPDIALTIAYNMSA